MESIVLAFCMQFFLEGAAEVELLQKQYAAKLQQLAKDQSIPDIQEILVKNGIDLPFLLSDHSSGFYSQTGKLFV